MNKYEITTEKKKREIISAAMSLFRENGFSGISIKEIAALANVSQVSIYNYFGSKDALITQCAYVVLEDVLKKAEEILNESGLSFVEKLKAALSICNENLSLTVSEYFSQKALEDPVLISLLMKSVNEIKKEIYRKYIEEGKRENVINTAIPTEIFLNFFNALNAMGFEMEHGGGASETVGYIHGLLLYGLIGK